MVQSVIKSTRLHPVRTLIKLTGNPFVDTGLAILAALNGCKNIDDLTLEKMRKTHGNGNKLARANLRLKSTFMIFHNSLITNPSIKEPKKNYSKVTTAILHSIGAEDIQERCEFCGNQSSLDIDKLVKRILGDNNGKWRRKYVGRDWFPLSGSLGGDAQALPSGSRGLNICATCLFAVQYLPQGVILIKGLLTIFQSTSIKFWYQLVRNIVNEVSDRLAAKQSKIETLGSREGSGVAVKRILAIMRRMRLDPGTSLIMWMFSNAGTSPDCQIDEIPNFALSFLQKCVEHGLSNEVTQLIVGEKKTGYKYSFLNCISKRLNYDRLYPSKGHYGVSPELFLLYQTYIRNYPRNSLYTAYKIAKYVNLRIDDNKKSVHLRKDIHKPQKQNLVRKLIIRLASEKGNSITFDEYYDLFIERDTTFIKINYDAWNLVKYYLSSTITHFKNNSNKEINNDNQQQQEIKDRIIQVGTAVFSSYIDRRGKERFKKDILDALARGKLHASWLRNQFEKLAEKDKDFDYDANWKLLCLNEKREEDIYELLYLFRLLFSTLV